MNCTTCGANLPQGATACPLCGTPTPYNAGRPGSSPQYDPTVAVPQAGPGSSPQLDPTMPAQPYGGTPPPSTAYGSPGYGTPPPPPNPYETPSYNAPASSQQQNYYGAPPQQQGGYVVPPPQQGGMYGTPQQPPKRRSRLGLILGIIALVLIVACAAISFAVYQGIKQTSNAVISANATSTAAAATSTSAANTTPTTSTNTTPTTSTSGNTGPSGTTIDPAAAGIITNVQMASAVDSNYKPTKVTSTFVTNKPVYATFNIDSNAPSSGFVITKWYIDGKLGITSKILAVQSSFLGYFSETYINPAQGTVELYWCIQSNCSDAKLADVANFTVTTAGIHLTQPPALAFMDINRP